MYSKYVFIQSIRFSCDTILVVWVATEVSSTTTSLTSFLILLSISLLNSSKTKVEKLSSLKSILSTYIFICSFPSWSTNSFLNFSALTFICVAKPYPINMIKSDGDNTKCWWFINA